MLLEYRMDFYFNNPIGCSVLDQTPNTVTKSQPGEQMSNYKNLHFILEKIKYNTLKFGITITIDPKYPYKNRRFKSMDDDKKHKVINAIISDYIKKRNCSLQYIIIPEYSPNGMLHYHGIVWNGYQKVFSNFVKYLRGKIGYCKSEMQLNNYDKWIIYIFKNYGKTGLSTITKIYDD